MNEIENDPFPTIKDTASWLTLQGKTFKMLHAVGVAGDQYIYYCHEDGLYYGRGKKLLGEEQFNRALPYLTWKYDQLVDQEVEVEVEQEYTTKSGNKSKRMVKEMRKTGNVINKFPPTPENIAKKRSELLDELKNSGRIPTEKEIKQLYYSASPRLKSHERFQNIERKMADNRAERYAQMLERGLL